MRLKPLLILFALAGLPPAAEAGIPVTRPMTCPIGGDAFDFTTTPSYSTWGSRPDGKPYGSWHFPLDLPECPSNRLIVYKEFSEEELARLAGLIEREEYRALGDEAQYYRLHWLLREMGEPAESHLWALLQAGWQVPEGSPQRAQYLGEFAAAMASREGEPQTLVDFAMRARWINALRELGRLGEAAALLRRTSLEPLREEGDRNERRDRQDWVGHYEMLGRLVERGDTRAEPLDAISERVAIARCADPPEPLTESDTEFCTRHAEAVARLRSSRRAVSD